jgi:hypothetical protein
MIFREIVYIAVKENLNDINCFVSISFINALFFTAHKSSYILKRKTFMNNRGIIFDDYQMFQMKYISTTTFLNDKLLLF